MKSNMSDLCFFGSYQPNTQNPHHCSVTTAVGKLDDWWGHSGFQNVTEVREQEKMETQLHRKTQCFGGPPHRGTICFNVN